MNVYKTPLYWIGFVSICVVMNFAEKKFGMSLGEYIIISLVLLVIWRFVMEAAVKK